MKRKKDITCLGIRSDRLSRYATFRQYGEDFSFYIDNPADLIQSRHAKGRLYEAEELEIIRANAPDDGVFYDIGANVGNHAVFMAKVLRAKRVYPFEANPRAVAILEKNITANGLNSVIDTSFLGFGIGAGHGSMDVHNPQENNLGAARLRPAENGSIEIRAIDGLGIPEAPDFVKIDVEGMEIDVLRGMASLLARKPPIFIEVNTANIGAFGAWADEHGYAVRETFVRYKSSVNYMVTGEADVSLNRGELLQQ